MPLGPRAQTVAPILPSAAAHSPFPSTHPLFSPSLSPPPFSSGDGFAGERAGTEGGVRLPPLSVCGGAIASLMEAIHHCSDEGGRKEGEGIKREREWFFFWGGEGIGCLGERERERERES